MARSRQRELDFHTWGGRRKGAGRKKGHRVSHGRRLVLKKRFPVHVTVRMADDICNLRSKRCFRELQKAFAGGRARFGFRLIEFSVQGNHVHLIVEAEDETSLARGMQGLNIRIAIAINRIMKRKGKVLADRYHTRILRNPTQVGHALNYVRRNYQKHAESWGEIIPASWRDPFSTAIPQLGVVSPPKTWMLSEPPDSPKHTPSPAPKHA